MLCIVDLKIPWIHRSWKLIIILMIPSLPYNPITSSTLGLFSFPASIWHHPLDINFHHPEEEQKALKFYVDQVSCNMIKSKISSTYLIDWNLMTRERLNFEFYAINCLMKSHRGCKREQLGNKNLRDLKKWGFAEEIVENLRLLF